MKKKTNAPKLNVCTETVAESFAGFSDRNLRKVALTLLKMVAKRRHSQSKPRTGLMMDIMRAVEINQAERSSVLKDFGTVVAVKKMMESERVERREHKRKVKVA